MTRHTKIQEIPAQEVLTRKTRKNVVPARVVEAESAEPVDEDEYFEKGVKTPSKKPRKMSKKKKADRKETLEEMSLRYTGVMQEYFSELNTDRRYDGFGVSCSLALGDMPGEVWIFANLTKSGHKIFHVACPVIDYPEDLHNVTGLLFIEMCLRGLRISEWKGI
jgi:hypothetical protein